MKNCMKFSLFICLLFIGIVLLFAACDKNNNFDSTSNSTSHIHAYSEWITIKEATCVEVGVQERLCDCGEKETKPIDLTEHIQSQEIEENRIEATCTTDGSYESVITCSVCLQELSRTQNIINSSGHQYDAIITLPTITDQGYTTHTCRVCFEKIVDSYVPATGSVGLDYIINSDQKTCTITGIGTNKDSAVYIPTIINGYQVTAIGENAFANCTHIKSINISRTVNTISRRAFYACTGITEITIPNTVNDLGEQLFLKAKNLNTVYYGLTAYNPLKDIMKLSHITKIVFNGDSLPYFDTWHRLGDYVKEIEVLGGIKEIPRDAFENCSSLTSVIIGDNVEKIGYGAFRGCSSLKSVIIGSRVKEIGDYAFGDCTGLTNITIPGNVTNLERYVFENCKSLKSAVLEKGIKELSGTFQDCINLTNVIIPDSVVTIDFGAFYRCKKLSNITLPNSVTEISWWSFEDCHNPITIHYDGDEYEWNIITFYGDKPSYVKIVFES